MDDDRIDELAAQIAETLTNEKFAESDFRLQATILDDGWAEAAIANLKNSTLSYSAKEGLILWINTYGGTAPKLANLTKKEELFELKAVRSLLIIPNKHTDLKNPSYEYFIQLFLDRYALSASRSVGVDRERILQSQFAVKVSSEPAAADKNSRKGWRQ